MFKKIILGFGIFIVLVYTLFLAAPLCVSGILNSHTSDIEKIIEESCGFKVKIENIKLVSTPKLTFGAKIGHLNVFMPDESKLLEASNIQAKLSLLPIIMKKIEIDMIGADNVDVSLLIDKKGKFLIEDCFKSDENSEKTSENGAFSMPYGIKLSNHLPDIRINDYKISIIEIPSRDVYFIHGNKLAVTDFILNKHIKVQTDGNIVFIDNEQFKFDIKLFNKIMPNVDLNDLVFSQQQAGSKAETVAFNVIDILKSLYKNKLTADIKADVTTYGTIDDINYLGNANISNISLLVDGKQLPASNLNFILKDHKINMNSEFYSAKDEITNFSGLFITGKHPKVDLNCKSNAKLNSVINIIDSVAKTFGYKDLDTLSATGAIDANFNIKSDLKRLETSGYLKVPQATLSYKLYNVFIDKIFADVNFDNNIINVKNAGLSILNQPLNIKGTISQNAEADLSLTADKLQIKGLLLAIGQAGLLKDNNIMSGTLSAEALIKGKLDKILPKIAVKVENLVVKNIPTNMIVKAPLADLSVGDKDILINQGYILLNNSRINYSGKISDYLTKDINFGINAKGNLISSDIKNMVPVEFRSEVYGTGSLPLNVSITGNDKAQEIAFELTSNPSNYLALFTVDELKGKTNVIKGNAKLYGDTLKFESTGIFANGVQMASLKGNITDLYKTQKLNLNAATLNKISMVVPFFKKSKMIATGNIDIGGISANPILKGSVNVTSVKIPELTLTMESLDASLNGPIVKGKGTLRKMAFGDIIAENLLSDFNLTNNIFYLTGMSGESFSGKINGNISYNISNGHIGVVLKASGMNAENAIRGAAGLKNALSGTLGFDANITTFGATDVEMVKNLKGKASFEVSDGEFGNIGRFENMLFAQNILANPIMKAAVSSVQNLATVKNTAKFKTISGNLSFDNGWAYLNPIKTSGPSMSYYIVGKYNILNATANVAVLGRISAEVVKLLGPLGELSVNKLTSYIPVFGKATGIIINAMTSDPSTEKTSFIPALSSGTTNYKDFKVEFNGGVESKSSIKSFKWLSKCDTSELESLTLKEQIEKTKEVIKDTRQQQIDAFNKKLEEQRQQAQEARQQMLDAKEGLKNLFKKPTSKNTTEQPAKTENSQPTQTENSQPIKTENSAPENPASDAAGTQDIPTTSGDSE